MALDWYYVYSPKYEIFHQLIYNSVSDCSGFKLHPCFFPQSAFSTLYKPGSEHFFAGNCLKFNVMLDAMKECDGRYIIVSDADLCILQSEQLRSYLEKYMAYDIVYMRDNLGNNTLNIGFGLIKCTPATLAFFTQVRNMIAETGRQDQAIVNELLGEHPELSVGMFSTPEMIQSNMYSVFYKEEAQFQVVQMLCSGTTFEHNYLEKLLTASVFYDLRDLEQLIPACIWNTMIKYLQDNNIPNPLASCEFKYVDASKFDESGAPLQDAPTDTQ
jgi:hypothetical protein